MLLHFTNDSQTDDCSAFSLFIQIQADGVWSPAEIVGEQDCLVEPSAFIFADDASFPAFYWRSNQPLEQRAWWAKNRGSHQYW